jgi:hypothetical protein
MTRFTAAPATGAQVQGVNLTGVVEIQMKTRSVIVAVAALSFATAALATSAAADVMTLGKKYSSSDLASICQRNDGAWYRAARGTYGCVAAGNVVECSNAGVCTGYTEMPFALVTTGAGNHRQTGAEAVLQTPLMPATQEATSAATADAIAAPQ